MKRFVCYFLSLSSIIYSTSLLAQSDSSADYEKVIDQRASKIVATLKLNDSSAALQLKNIIATQYKSLGKIHDAKNKQLANTKLKKVDQAVMDSEIKKIEADADIQLQRLHKQYLSNLSAMLSAQQLDQIKDGMTYNLVFVTYNAYQDMIPTLTKEQKEQIMKWLVEAREQAIDAESSEKKHWWFGKYKGRINNYLAAQGYDLQKERTAWQTRLKEREEEKKTTQNQQ